MEIANTLLLILRNFSIVYSYEMTCYNNPFLDFRTRSIILMYLSFYQVLTNLLYYFVSSNCNTSTFTILLSSLPFSWIIKLYTK